jgi:hypothetical protein
LLVVWRGDGVWGGRCQAGDTGHNQAAMTQAQWVGGALVCRSGVLLYGLPGSGSQLT